MQALGSVNGNGKAHATAGTYLLAHSAYSTHNTHSTHSTHVCTRQTQHTQHTNYTHTCCTRPLALSMGMAKPTPLLDPDPDRMAVLMPTSSQRLLSSGPPDVVDCVCLRPCVRVQHAVVWLFDAQRGRRQGSDCVGARAPLGPGRARVLSMREQICFDASQHMKTGCVNHVCDAVPGGCSAL